MRANGARQTFTRTIEASGAVVWRMQAGRALGRSRVVDFWIKCRSLQSRVVENAEDQRTVFQMGGSYMRFRGMDVDVSQSDLTLSTGKRALYFERDWLKFGFFLS